MYLGPKEGGDPVLSLMRGSQSPVRAVVRTVGSGQAALVLRLEHHARAVWAGTIIRSH